jgi:GT2 family glycosyltransferase
VGAGTAAVIVNWNAGAHLDRCLEALLEQTVPLARIIVIDNASSDGSLQGIAARSDRIEVVRLDRNRGFAAATNLGIRRAAEAEWIALVNPDVFPRPDWLERLLIPAERRPEYSFFASLQLDAGEPTRLDGAGDVYSVSGLAWRRFHGEPVQGTPLGRAEEVFGPCAAAALYRRAALTDVGGLDESFFCYFEDVDLAFRLRLAGHRCLFVPDAVALHVGSAVTGRRSEFTTYYGHRNLVWCWFKNMPAPLAAAYLSQHLVLNLLSGLWYARRGHGGTLLRAKRDALLGLPPVLRARRHVQAQRRVGSRALRAQMASGPTVFARWRSA